jgi:hypothetical protein
LDRTKEQGDAVNENSPYLGKWKITQMGAWDSDYIDLVVPGYIEFKTDQGGSFQFGTVKGWIDYRIERFNDVEMIAFSWEGTSHTDPGCGRGWAMIVGKDNELYGRIFIHCSDDHDFHAKKIED